MPQHHLTAFENKSDYRIRQGSRYSLTIKVPGDKTTGYNIKAHIKRKPTDDSTLAIFNVIAPAYDATTDKTAWTIFLTASQTANTPKTKRVKRDETVIGTHVWCWDVLLEDLQDSDNNLRIITISYVEVIEEVTVA
jgi:hypothetical protein